MVQSMPFIWGFKPVLSYSKTYTSSTFFGEEKERNMHSPSNQAKRQHHVTEVCDHS